MKGFERENQLLSLCGLNCALCPMELGGYCGGCGNGNQSCAIARCAMAHGNPEYCFQCGEYPCPEHCREEPYDSFITHQRRLADLERARELGIEHYNREQREKRKILDGLLAGFNDGRRKTLFCQAVNLLELPQLRQAMERIQSKARGMDIRAAAACAAKILEETARERGISLKLRKQKRTKESKK